MSYINLEYRHVFIHVPKTGGTSMYTQPFVGGGHHQTALQLVPQRPDWFSWGFVRNPYDRLLSIYNAARQHGTKWKEVDELTFEEFALAVEDKGLVLPHSLPMVHFLCDRNQQVLVDFVGRFESMDADWKEVCRRIGVPHVPMKHLNKSRHAPWTEVYTRDAIAAVNRIYAADFEIFGYDKL